MGKPGYSLNSAKVILVTPPFKKWGKALIFLGDLIVLQAFLNFEYIKIQNIKL